jgi:hypothetical protein
VWPRLVKFSLPIPSILFQRAHAFGNCHFSA